MPWTPNACANLSQTSSKAARGVTLVRQRSWIQIPPKTPTYLRTVQKRKTDCSEKERPPAEGLCVSELSHLKPSTNHIVRQQLHGSIFAMLSKAWPIFSTDSSSEEIHCSVNINYNLCKSRLIVSESYPNNHAVGGKWFSE